MVVGLVINFLVSILLGMYCYYLKHNEQRIVELNSQRQKENEAIEKENKQLKLDHNDLITRIQTQDSVLKSLSATRTQLEADAETLAKKVYESKLDELMAKYREREGVLAADYATLIQQVSDEQKKLNQIEAKQLAYIQAKQREQQMELQKDYYRLAIPETDLSDIALLRDIQLKIKKVEVIDKVIYENFFRAAYNTLMAHICNSQAKISGVYKITDLKTGESYIGQSVDIKERLKTHIKTGLSSKPATNKLYKAMKQDGVENFTFEVLEEVSRDMLNEREVYWIEFYKTREFGLNDTKGGA